MKLNTNYVSKEGMKKNVTEEIETHCKKMKLKRRQGKTGGFTYWSLGSRKSKLQIKRKNKLKT